MKAVPKDMESNYRVHLVQYSPADTADQSVYQAFEVALLLQAVQPCAPQRSDLAADKALPCSARYARLTQLHSQDRILTLEPKLPRKATKSLFGDFDVFAIVQGPAICLPSRKCAIRACRNVKLVQP